MNWFAPSSHTMYLLPNGQQSQKGNPRRDFDGHTE